MSPSPARLMAPGFRHGAGWWCTAAVALLLAACAAPQERGARALARGDLAAAGAWADRAEASGADLAADLLRVDVALARGEAAEAGRLLAPHESGDAGAPVWQRAWRVGVETDDPRRAAEAWLALDGAVSDPRPAELDEAIRLDVARALVPYGPRRLTAYLDAGWAARPEALLSGLDPSLDLLLYQSALRGDIPRALDELDAWETTLGQRFVIEKHRTLLHLTSPARRDGVQRLDALTGGDATLVDALAFEFAARGAVRGAEQAYRYLATISDEAAPASLLEAGRLAYRSMREEAARTALREAWERSGGAIDIAARGVQIADARGDLPFAIALATEAIAGRACTPETQDALLDLEARVASADLRDDAFAAAAERFERRIELGCDIGATAAVAAPLLAQAGATRLADDFYDRAIRYGPGRAGVALDAVRFAARGGRIDRIIATMEGWLLFEQPGSASDTELRDLLRELDASLPEDELARVADWVAAAFDAQPQSGFLARRLAFEVARGADVEATLSRYIAASDDPLAARARTALWRVEAGDESDELVAFLDALAADAAGSEDEPPFVYRGAGTFESTVHMLQLDLLLARGERDRAIDRARRVVDASRADASTAWRVVWQHREFRDRLRPDQLHRLLGYAIADGFDDPDALVADGLALLDMGDVDGALVRLRDGLQHASQLVDLAGRLLAAGHAWYLLDLLPYVSDDTDPGALALVEADAWLRLAQTTQPPLRITHGAAGLPMHEWRTAVFEARAVRALQQAADDGAGASALLNRLDRVQGPVALRTQLRLARLDDVEGVDRAALLFAIARDAGWTSELAATLGTLPVDDPAALTPRLRDTTGIPFAAASTLATRALDAARGDPERTVSALRLVSALVFRSDAAPEAWLPILRVQVLPDLRGLLDPNAAPPRGATAWSIELRRGTGCALLDRLTWTLTDAGAWADADALLSEFGRDCPTAPDRFLTVRRAAQRQPLTADDFREAYALRPELSAYEFAGPWTPGLVRPDERAAAATAALEAARLAGAAPAVTAAFEFAIAIEGPDAAEAANLYAERLVETRSSSRQLEGALRLMELGYGDAALSVLRVLARGHGGEADIALPLATRIETAHGRTELVDELASPRAGRAPAPRVQFDALNAAWRDREALTVAEGALRSSAGADAWRWIANHPLFERTGRLDLIAEAVRAGGDAAAPLAASVAARLRGAGDTALAAGLADPARDPHARLAVLAQRARSAGPLEWRPPHALVDAAWELTALRELLVAYRGVDAARAWLEAQRQQSVALADEAAHEIALLDAHRGALDALGLDDGALDAGWRAGAFDEVLASADPHRDPAWAAMRGEDATLDATGLGAALRASVGEGDADACRSAPVEARVACAWHHARTPDEWVELAAVDRGQPLAPIDEALHAALTAPVDEAAFVAQELVWDPTPRPIAWPEAPPVEASADPGTLAAWLRHLPDPTEARLTVADLLDAVAAGTLDVHAADAVRRRGCDAFGVGDLAATAVDLHAWRVAAAVVDAGARCATLHAPALHPRAVAALQLRDGDAGTHVRALLDSAPEPVSALERLIADLLLDEPSLRAIAPEATRLMAHGAGSPLARSLRALDRALRGDASGAVDDLAWARGSSGAWPLLVQATAHALLDAGEREAAVEAAAQLLSIAYDERAGLVSGATQGLWSAMVALDPDADAVELLLATYAPGARDAPVLSGVGSAWVPALEASGRVTEALLLSERIYRDAPLSSGAANLFAWERALAGVELAEAEQAARTALSQSTLLQASPSVLDTLAYILLERGDAHAAAAWQRLALRRAAMLGYAPTHPVRQSLADTMARIDAALALERAATTPEASQSRGRRTTSRQ